MPRAGTLVSAAAAVASVGLAIAIAIGAVGYPQLAQALSDAVDTIGWWVFLAAPALIFLETSVFAGWLIHGELVLMASGRADADGRRGVGGGGGGRRDEPHRGAPAGPLVPGAAGAPRRSRTEDVPQGSCAPPGLTWEP